MPLRKYTAVTKQGHDRRPWSIFEWKAIWEVFKAFSPPLLLGVSLSPREQHQESIDCWGPVVSQRLSPLTNPLALCHLLTTVIDCYSLGHSNYTQLQSGHLFQHFHHLPKKISFIFVTQQFVFAAKAERGTHKIPTPAPEHDGASVTRLTHIFLSHFLSLSLSAFTF